MTDDHNMCSAVPSLKPYNCISIFFHDFYIFTLPHVCCYVSFYIGWHYNNSKIKLVCSSSPQQILQMLFSQSNVIFEIGCDWIYSLLLWNIVSYLSCEIMFNITNWRSCHFRNDICSLFIPWIPHWALTVYLLSFFHLQLYNKMQKQSDLLHVQKDKELFQMTWIFYFLQEVVIVRIRILWKKL